MATQNQVQLSNAPLPVVIPAEDRSLQSEPVCPLCGLSESREAFSDNGCKLLVCDVCDLFFVHPYPGAELQHERVVSGKNPLIGILDCEKRYQGERLFYDRHFPLIAEECAGARSVLDVGCGTGHLLEKLSALPGIFCAGIELNPEAAEFARHVSGRRIWQTPLEEFRSEGKFDAVTMINVFSHIPSFDRLFDSLRDLLNPGGKVILRTTEMKRSVSRWNQAHWGIPDDLHFLGIGTLEFLCAKYDFQIARRIRTPYEDELFCFSRWQQMGRSRVRNLVKKAGVRIPMALPILKSVYRAALGERLFMSFIVLTPREKRREEAPAPHSDAAKTRGFQHLGPVSRNPKPDGPSHPRSPFWLRTIRTQPHLYSAICKARLAYSRRIAGAAARQKYRENFGLFGMNSLEAEQVESLRRHGYSLVPRFIPPQHIDRVYRQADALFRDLQIDCQRAYSVQSGRRESLAGLSYEDLARSEKMIALREPLVQIPELAEIAFHESILKIAANFLGCIPPLYGVTVVRDFPQERALHSSNFHKDNDEADSLQIFIYLVDIDDAHGPLVYIPGSNRYDVRSCRPRLSRDLGIPSNDGRLSDEEVERVYPRNAWATLRTPRGSVAAIHGNGIHKGPAWARPGDPRNQPRTAIKLDLHGYKDGVARDERENRMRKSDFEKLTELQRLFAHATLVEEPALAMAQSD
ncbi:MAG TPA: methyltransferase domain-containing protein [Candidatus Sulfotelmatobacter sp.]|nr:methyltransferase domain-containing protein [Candidatus Sulfotelmatobacter sp.]